MGGVTVCIALCTYNGAAYLAEQLDSLGRQTRPPDRVVAVDDGSDDATVALLREFASQVPFPVEVHRNAQNLGYLRNFEKAIRLCEGDIIALCDQDDVWHPEKLTTIEEVFLKRPDTGMVFSDADVVDAELRSLGYRLWEALHFTPARQAQFARDGGYSFLLRGNIVTGATMAFQSRFRELILPMGLGVVHDAWISLLVSALAPVRMIPSALVAYRQHMNNQLGVRRRGLAERITWARRVQASHFEDLYDQHRQALERLCSRPEVESYRLQQLELAMQHFDLRSRLPRRRYQRLRPVLGEFARGGYNRMANGFTSAVRDLVV